MSKQLKTQVVEVTCDGCGQTKQYELAVNPGSMEENMLQQALADWYYVGRKFIVNGQPFQQQMDACSLECVPAAAVKVTLPPDLQEPDLASLQVNRSN
jgi:hypothetical protein